LREGELLRFEDVYLHGGRRVYFIVDEERGCVYALGETYRRRGWLLSRGFRWRDPWWVLQVAPYPLSYMVPDQRREELRRLRFTVKKLWMDANASRLRAEWLLYAGNHTYRKIDDVLGYAQQPVA